MEHQINPATVTWVRRERLLQRRGDLRRCGDHVNRAATAGDVSPAILGPGCSGAGYSCSRAADFGLTFRSSSGFAATRRRASRQPDDAGDASVRHRKSSWTDFGAVPQLAIDWQFLVVPRLMEISQCSATTTMLEDIAHLTGLNDLGFLCLILMATVPEHSTANGAVSPGAAYFSDTNTHLRRPKISILQVPWSIRLASLTSTTACALCPAAAANVDYRCCGAAGAPILGYSTIPRAIWVFVLYGFFSVRSETAVTVVQTPPICSSVALTPPQL